MISISLHLIYERNISKFSELLKAAFSRRFDNDAFEGRQTAELTGKLSIRVFMTYIK
jgi:hypothetical protein